MATIETLTTRLETAANGAPEYAEAIFMDCLATFGADDFRTSAAFRALTIAEARNLRTLRESGAAQFEKISA